MSFLERCVLFFTHSLGIGCNIDNFAHVSDSQNPETYKFWEYTIIRDPNNSNFAFIWSPGSYFLVNLGSATSEHGPDILVDMSIFSPDMPQKYGKIKKAGIIPDTVCTGLITQCKGTGVPSNSRPLPFSLAGSPASKREQNSGVGLELDVNGTNRLVIVYNGKPNKSLSRNNIFAQDYYIKETYMINYKTTKLKYIRTDIQSYTNGVAPAIQ